MYSKIRKLCPAGGSTTLSSANYSRAKNSAKITEYTGQKTKKKLLRGSLSPGVLHLVACQLYCTFVICSKYLLGQLPSSRRSSSRLWAIVDGLLSLHPHCVQTAAGGVSFEDPSRPRNRLLPPTLCQFFFTLYLFRLKMLELFHMLQVEKSTD